MKIKQEKGDTVLKQSRSIRDVKLGKDIPMKSGLPTSSAVMLNIGTCGAGKSHFLESLFAKQWKKVFHKIFLICPEGSRSSYKNSFTKKVDPSRVFSELTVENLDKIAHELETDSLEVDDDEELEPEHYVLVIDDCQAAMKGSDVSKALRFLMSTHRHFSGGLTIIICLQNLMALPKDCRDLASHVVLFRGLSSWQQMERVNSEFLPHLRKNEMLDLFKYIYDTPHNFSIISRRGDGGITKNFDPLTVTTDELD